MSDRRASVRISEGGRIVLPAPMRKAMGLEVGDRVILLLDDDCEIRLFSRSQGIRRAQALLREAFRGAPSLADELIAERRAEAQRE